MIAEFLDGGLTMGRPTDNVALQAGLSLHRTFHHKSFSVSLCMDAFMVTAESGCSEWRR